MDIRRIMRTTLCLGCVVAMGSMLASCNKDETYADQKDKERKAVGAFTKRSPQLLTGRGGDTLLYSAKPMKIISQQQFEAQDSMTNAEENEYVLFENSGVYMQIVRKGEGQKLHHGESGVLACRYWEYDILGDSLLSTNLNSTFSVAPEYINVSNNSGTFTASFNTTIYPGGGAMYRLYKKLEVLEGWTVPLTYIRPGRQDEKGIAKVRLIVPHSQGTKTAKQNVSPMCYEITYQRLR